MKPIDPIIITNMSQKQFDLFTSISRGEGLDFVNSSNHGNYDGLGGVSVKYDKDRETMTVNASKPFWMTEGAAVGHFHAMISQAMNTNIDPNAKVPAQPATNNSTVAAAK